MVHLQKIETIIKNFKYSAMIVSIMLSTEYYTVKQKCTS